MRLRPRLLPARLTEYPGRALRSVLRPAWAPGAGIAAGGRPQGPALSAAPGKTRPPLQAGPRHPLGSEAPLRALVISGSVGAGHDGAAAELVRRLAASGVEADVRDFLDALPRPYRRVLRDGYEFSATHAPGVFDWLFRSNEQASAVRRMALHACRRARGPVADWAAAGYDVVVTTFPFAAQTLGMLKSEGALRLPAVCYLTDPAPHWLWVHPRLDAHLTVTEATAAEGTARYGVPMAAAGPLAPEVFAQRPVAADRRAVRTELGIAEGHRMALLVTGSLGLGDVMASVRAMGAAPDTVPVVLCGRNERLRRRVAEVPGVVALGWRKDVPRLMAAADVLVHNAGGLSLTEALVSGLPAVSYEVLSGHGRANAATLAAAGIAPWPRTPAALAEALEAQAGRGRVHLPALPPERQAAGVVEALARQGRQAAGDGCHPVFGRRAGAAALLRRLPRRQTAAARPATAAEPSAAAAEPSAAALRG